MAAAADGDDGTVARHLIEPSLELAQGDVLRARDVPRDPLLILADVEQMALVADGFELVRLHASTVPTVQPPYPIDIVPLIPQFLLRRTVKFDFPLRASERLGIDRPAFQFVFTLSVVPEAGATPQQIGNAAYYTILDFWRPQAVVAESAGLATEERGCWRLTERGEALMREMRAERRAYFQGLEPIAAADIERLADLFERAFRASMTSLPQDENSHIPRVARYRRGEPLDSPMAKLDAAINALWATRDDAHMAAWRAAGIDGPALDALTRIWREEAATLAELAPKLAQQRPEDVAAAVERLRAKGWVEPGEPLRATESGRSARQAIEEETDRLFFSAWPEDIGRQAPWMRERLEAINQALA